MTLTARILLTSAATAALAACATIPEAPAETDMLGLGSLDAIAEVDPRFQSYNVEMVEVTGGRFWAPYGGPEGEVYRMRPPMDLTNPKLRALAGHLAPAYMRVSGTWANTTYLPAEGEDTTEPPEGYNQVLTRDQWRGAVAFSEAADAPIVTSFAVSPGTRDDDGVWQTEQAERLLELTREEGGTIAAAEFFNEPNAHFVGGLPKGYGTQDYIRDFRIFRSWAMENAPDMMIIGTGGVGESDDPKIPVAMQNTDFIFSRDTMSANPNTLDAVSYHFYGTVSQRCQRSSLKPSELKDALTIDWLDRTLEAEEYYGSLRDEYEPGDPLWITETAQAACGGSPWANSYIDTFRYTNQMGLLAQRGVGVLFHNTLAASDYALLDEENYDPTPNYWAAVLWQRLMGETVLASPQSSSTDLRLYAHCQKGQAGGVALLAINLGDTAHSLPVLSGSQVWQMTAPELTATEILINGVQPVAAEDGSLSGLDGVAAGSDLAIPAKGIAYVAVPNAGNASCS